jgi:hypothetical protein
MSEKQFHFVVVVLLGTLVFLQIIMLYRLPTPVTVNSLITASPDQVEDIIKQVPLVRVQGGFVNIH